MCLSLLNLISSDLKDCVSFIPALVHSYWPSCHNSEFNRNLVFGWTELSYAFLLFAAMPHVQGQKHNQGFFFFFFHQCIRLNNDLPPTCVVGSRIWSVLHSVELWEAFFLAARCAVSNVDPCCMLWIRWLRAWLHSAETSSRVTSIL